ncbi:hypothetical protein BY998_13531 [Methylobacterium sp. B4]|nr:hypothetical protein BY998_13531 [Methylobacterium sp. B4]
MREEVVGIVAWFVIGFGAWSLSVCVAYYGGWWKGYGAAFKSLG